MADSCLVTKLSNFISLSDSDREIVEDLEKTTRQHDSGSTIFRGGEPWKDMLVVGDGWLYSYTLLEDGKRHVLQIHYPGDIIGTFHLPFSHALFDLDAATDVEVCPFPKSQFDTLITRAPSVAALLFSFAMVDHAVLFDRLRAVSRMRAADRVCYLLLEIGSRLRVTTGSDPEQGFRLPVNQSVIGDALGLTNVSVSRAMTELEAEGAVHRTGALISFDERELTKRVDFHDRFRDLRTDWFPGQGSPSVQ